MRHRSDAVPSESFVSVEPGIRQDAHSPAHGRAFAEAIVDTIREAILVLSPDLRVRSANARFYALFGVSRAETEGRLIYELGDGQWDLPELRRLLDDVLPDDTGVEGYEVTLTFDGLGERTMLLNARRLDHQQLILLAVEDVTERRRAELERDLAEENHREGEERLRLALDAARMGVWDLDARTGAAYRSERFYEIYGYEPRPSRATAEDFYERVHPDDRPRVREAIEAALRDERPYRETFRIVRPDGEVRWVRSQGQAVHDAAGAVVRLMGVVYDITEQQQAEEALRESEERLRGTFENAAVGIAHVAPDGAWLRVNRRLCAIVGYTREEFLACTFQDITHPDDLEADLALLRRVLAGEIAEYQMEKRYVHKDGHPVWINLTVAPAYGPDGTIRYLISIIEDISEKKAAEEALRRLNETLEARVRERTRQVRALAARLATAEQEERHRLAQVLHDDLQQQLFGLSMTLDLLRDPPSPEAGRELLDRADAILAQATALTRSLSVDLSPPVLASERMSDLLLWLADRKRSLYGLEVDVEAEGDFAMPDRDARVLLLRSLRELLFNVVKHAGTRRARVRAWSAGPDVGVRVEDEGAGFDVAAVMREDAEATGFGLHSIRERVELAGGRFEIDSAPGRGTRTTIVLPAVRAAPDREKA